MCAASFQLEKYKNALRDGREVIEFELSNNTKAHTNSFEKVEEGRKSMEQLVDSDENGVIYLKPA